MVVTMFQVLDSNSSVIVVNYLLDGQMEVDKIVFTRSFSTGKEILS
jgi:hypothetical protein